MATESRSVAARRWVLDYGIFILFGTMALVGVYLFLSRDVAFARRLLENERYWMPALFAVFVLEGAMLMYFAPSEALVPFALAAIGSSVEDIAVIVGIAVLGATVGQYLLFLLAKRGGRERLLERPWFRVSEERLERFDGWFDRWGPLVVPVSNSLLFTRGMLTVPAGFAEMRDREFVALSALGTLSFELIWAGIALGVFAFLGI
jgi:membrane protein DedA with SNARE-associated domain